MKIYYKINKNKTEWKNKEYCCKDMELSKMVDYILSKGIPKARISVFDGCCIYDIITKCPFCKEKFEFEEVF